MRIGVFTVLFQKLPFEAALDKIAAVGATAVEIGAGGYCGTHHCPVDDLLEGAEKRKAYLSAIHSRADPQRVATAHAERLHPDKNLAQASAEASEKSVRLAQLLEVPVVMALSSCPARGRRRQPQLDHLPVAAALQRDAEVPVGRGRHPLLAQRSPIRRGARDQDRHGDAPGDAGLQRRDAAAHA